MVITIDDKNIETKLNKLSQKKHKDITQVISDIIEDYEDTDETDADFIKKYKKLDPREYSTVIDFVDEFPDLKETNPFKNIENVAEYAEELRKRAWR